MTALYDFYETPNPDGNRKHTRYHARTIPNGTVTTDQLADDIHNRCSLTTADVKATLIALSEVVSEHLKEGRRIHIEGLGFVQVTLQCPDIQSAKEIRAESVRFKSVAFRPEAALKQKLKTMKVERAQRKQHSSDFSDEEIREGLKMYFKSNETLTRRQFQRLFGLAAATANRRLKTLRESGLLINISHPRNPIYKRGEGV